jgi:hypothetical protein
MNTLIVLFVLVRKDMDVNTKAAAYFSLVRPNLEYCASIWNPYSIQSINVFQDHQRPSGYSIIQLPHTSQQQDEIQPLKEDAAVPAYKIRCFQVQFLS